MLVRHGMLKSIFKKTNKQKTPPKNKNKQTNIKKQLITDNIINANTDYVHRSVKRGLGGTKTGQVT